MLDNLTGGRVIMAFLRGIPSEDLPYGMNPAEGRARLFEGMDLLLKALTASALFLGRTLLPIPYRVVCPGRCSSLCRR